MNREEVVQARHRVLVPLPSEVLGVLPGDTGDQPLGPPALGLRLLGQEQSGVGVTRLEERGDAGRFELRNSTRRFRGELRHVEDVVVAPRDLPAIDVLEVALRDVDAALVAVVVGHVGAEDPVLVLVQHVLGPLGRLAVQTLAEVLRHLVRDALALHHGPEHVGMPALVVLLREVRAAQRDEEVLLRRRALGEGLADVAELVVHHTEVAVLRGLRSIGAGRLAAFALGLVGADALAVEALDLHLASVQLHVVVQVLDEGVTGESTVVGGSETGLGLERVDHLLVGTAGVGVVADADPDGVGGDPAVGRPAVVALELRDTRRRVVGEGDLPDPGRALHSAPCDAGLLLGTRDVGAALGRRAGLASPGAGAGATAGIGAARRLASRGSRARPPASRGTSGSRAAATRCTPA